MRNGFRRWAFLLVTLLACAGGGGDSVTPTNHPPTIEFTFAKIGVPRAVPVNLSVAVDDPDGDKLTITWSPPTRGTLTPQNASRSVMQWATPVTVGTDSVTVSVTDGTFTRKVTASLKVGWASSGQSALSTYEKAKSPYIISPPALSPIVSVPEGTTTTIEPGTELLIDTPGAAIDVAGTFIANGTDAEHAVIRPNDRTFQCGDERGWWDGIRGVTVSDGTTTYNGFIDLNYAEIWYAQDGVRLRDDASAVLKNSMFRCSGDSGVRVEGSGSFVALDSEISNGRGDGIIAFAFSSLPDSIYIRGCDISINEASGLRLDLSDPSQTVPITVEYNKFEFNFTSGITLAQAIFPQIHFNHFSGNGLGGSVVNIFLENGYPSGTTFPELDASCNYWGSVVNNQATIDATIRDSLDSGSVGTRILTSPWLNASPLTTPPTCTPPAP